VPASVVDAGTCYVFQPIGQDPDGDRLIFSIQNRPIWTTFDPSTGSLSGVPTRADAGIAGPIVIGISDGKVFSALPPFSIRVNAPNSAPSLTGSPARQAQVGTPYSFTPSASDNDGDRLTFTIAGRPSWAAFDVSSGRLSGTPAQENIGTGVGITISAADGFETTSLPAFSITVASTNRAPTLTGSPVTSVMAGRAYGYTPQASDPDGDPLSFTIANRPRWAAFDTGTGRLSGTPLTSDVGVYAGISITASDGRSSATMSPFSVTVEPDTAASVELAWDAPTTNTDGSRLADLAGYRLRYGRSADALNQVMEIRNPSVTSFEISGLTAGTWYFALRAYNVSGVESPLSNIASKTLP